MTNNVAPKITELLKQLRKAEQDVQLKNRSDSPEYRASKRNTAAIEMIETVLEMATYDSSDSMNDHVAKRTIGLLADALAQAERDGMRRASNAISALEA